MRKKKLYVTGYDLDSEPICGKPITLFGSIYPMTLNQAKMDLKQFNGTDAVIYQLVKVDPKKI